LLSSALVEWNSLCRTGGGAKRANRRLLEGRDEIEFTLQVYGRLIDEYERSRQRWLARMAWKESDGTVGTGEAAGCSSNFVA